MRRGVVCLAALVVLTVGSVGLAQAPASGAVATPVDIYAKFVGTWVGSSRFWRDGAEQTEHLKIEITEEKPKHRLRLVYTYGQPGEKGFDHRTRFITLDPAKGEMTSYFVGDTRTKHKPLQAVGLAEFAKDGYGNFTMSEESVDPDGRRVASRCTFVLDADVFGYLWAQSVDGGPFAPYSVIKLKREDATSASGSQP
jgi:hypothetical protein